MLLGSVESVAIVRGENAKAEVGHWTCLERAPVRLQLEVLPKADTQPTLFPAVSRNQDSSRLPDSVRGCSPAAARMSAQDVSSKQLAEHRAR